MDSGTVSDSDSKPYSYIVLHYRTFHTAQTGTWSYFCIGQEFESESVPVSKSNNMLKHYGLFSLPDTKTGTKTVNIGTEPMPICFGLALGPLQPLLSIII